ncbi:DUF2269 family protein [Desulfoscipio sp. XC116]|uniref:DUF2269 family protein n=1 Tax=Desulfoscipio sp. XC116 TaxID=3144975 RepID=UPI00325B7854
MKNLSLKGRAWLKSFHILFCCAWVGAALSIVLLGLVKGHVPNGDELYAVNASIKLVDDYIIIPAALGSLITGLLICWLTNWGFFKHKWIIVKLVMTVGQILFGTFFLGKWTNGAAAITDMERALSLQNQTYLYFREMSSYFGSAQAFLLIVLVFISVFKPWRVKKEK